METKQEEKENPIYTNNVVEFVTVAVEFCTQTEICVKMRTSDFLARMTRISALLYLKGSLLPEMISGINDELNNYVTEEEYNQIRQNVATVMGEYDSYLETQNSDMQYSDTPIAASVSEDLADVYQILRDTILNFKTANPQVMNEALVNCKEDFKNVWGEKLINALGAMHNVLYSPNADLSFRDGEIPDKNEDDAI